MAGLAGSYVCYAINGIRRCLGRHSHPLASLARTTGAVLFPNRMADRGSRRAAHLNFQHGQPRVAAAGRASHRDLRSGRATNAQWQGRRHIFASPPFAGCQAVQRSVRTRGVVPMTIGIQLSPWRFLKPPRHVIVPHQPTPPSCSSCSSMLVTTSQIACGLPHHLKNLQKDCFKTTENTENTQREGQNNAGTFRVCLCVLCALCG
jgi:hypothetical protein